MPDRRETGAGPTYQALDPGLDDTVRWGTLGGQFLKALLVAHLVTMFPLTIVLAQWWADTEISDFLVILAVVLGMISYTAVLMFGRATEPVAEWRVLLSGRHHRAEDVHRRIGDALRERGGPLSAVPHRVPLPAGAGANHRLRVGDGQYQAYVSVFPHGTGLYVGWTMWRSRRGWQLVLRFLLDVWSGFAAQDADERRTIRAERPRAMLESVHLACREAVAAEAVATEAGTGAGETVTSPAALGNGARPPVTR
ncbi:hypothetical protein [Streptomyces specialis]|uniref:hypothetical protein n=1 Tax=Streptomyces specialis TaxID=498367 RepID=UPI00073F87C4|nr:hypothetical protein [Streptomyces specialis]